MIEMSKLDRGLRNTEYSNRDNKINLEGLILSDKDNINPSHYTQGKYETIDIILDRAEHLPGDQATLVGNIIKYLWRYDRKNGVEDLNKSKWYLDKLIEVVEDEQV